MLRQREHSITTFPRAVKGTIDERPQPPRRAARHAAHLRARPHRGRVRRGSIAARRDHRRRTRDHHARSERAATVRADVRKIHAAVRWTFSVGSSHATDLSPVRHYVLTIEGARHSFFFPAIRAGWQASTFCPCTGSRRLATDTARCMSLGSRGTHRTLKVGNRFTGHVSRNRCGITCGYVSPGLCKYLICSVKHLFTWVAILCPS